jgi:hypothetical protein
MASAADLGDVEEACPWLQEDFRADLELLAGARAAAARMYAADLRVIARLAARVPRCAFDETGSSPWTSFRREVAVARRVTDRAAAQLIRCALRLTGVLPQAMALLETGVLTPGRAVAFVTELEVVDDQLAGRVDAELAEAIALLPCWRIEQEVRKAVLRLDPEAAAARVAVKNAGREVQLHPDVDDQACVTMSGPAVPLVRWYAALDARARALKAAGDPRTLDALRYDLATSTYPCDVHPPADTAAGEEAVDNQANAASENPAPAPADEAAAAAAKAEAAEDESEAASAEAGLRTSFVEPAPKDCRRSRPVQAKVVVPVETALGLSNDPAWLDGYGWISAPTCRQLVVDAELRQACAKTGTGELVDLAVHDQRPPPTPTGLRDSLLAMVLGDLELSDVGWRTEPQHDPTDRLREFVTVRDRACDGPTGARVSAARAELDHDTPWPAGPTAAWNLTARGSRTHQLKHYGWTPLRTATGTVWISPAGQSVQVPRHTNPPPGIDPDLDGRPPTLPDPDELAHLDQLQLTPPTDNPPAFAGDFDGTPWTWLGDDEPAPF